MNKSPQLGLRVWDFLILLIFGWISYFFILRKTNVITGAKIFRPKKTSQIVSSRFLLIDFALQHERVDYITLKLSPT